MSTVVPAPTPETAHLWAGYSKNELPLQECVPCGTLRFLPAQHCSACGCPDWRIRNADGAGTIFSYVITRRPEGLPVVDEFPVIALVELAEGVRLVSNTVDVPVEQVRIGLPVRACFDEVRAEDGTTATLVRFRADTIHGPSA